MIKYKVLRTNYGFQGRMWTEGEIVEFADDVTPPHHFELYYGEEVKEEPKVEVNDPMKPQKIEIGKPIIPKGGFTAKHDFQLPKKTVTAGEAMKKDKGVKRPHKGE